MIECRAVDPYSDPPGKSLCSQPATHVVRTSPIEDRQLEPYYCEQHAKLYAERYTKHSGITHEAMRVQVAA